MKPIFSLILSLLLPLSLSAQSDQGFTIRGHLSGLKKGVSISILKDEKPLDFDRGKSNAEADAFEGAGIMDAMTPDNREVAKTFVTKDGVFELHGHIDRPQLVTLITNNLDMVEKANKGKSDEERFAGIRWTYTPIFLENAEYTIGTNKYELLTDEPITDKCVITGGEVQADFNAYNLMLKASQGDKEYLEGKDRDAVVRQFIASHPTSVVSVYLADHMLDDSSNMTAEEIRSLASSIMGCPLDTARYNRFVQKARIAELTASGNPVVDLELTSDKGDATTLVAAIPSGKYVLVDFWASWCGICRSFTPAIKEIYNKYPRSRFEVISVSCDTSDERWRSAMQKDQMPWAQYLLTKQGYSDFFAKYQTNGVPYLLLVGPDGKVVCNPDRPSQVDSLLQKFLNE